MKESRQRNRAEIAKTIVAIILVSGLILTLGTGAFVIGIQEFIAAKSSGNWPSVNGIIFHSEVKVTRESGSRSGATSRTTYSYQPVVNYQYLVNDKQLTGETIRYGLVTNRPRAEETVAKYPLKAKVIVYYNPDKPEQSVLEPGYSGGLLFMPVMGLVVIGCGLLSVYLIWTYGSSIAESTSSLIGQHFLLRAAAFIIGALVVFFGLAYLMQRFLYG